MRKWLILSSVLAAGCNDLTDPLPSIAGSYDYTSFSSEFISLNRRGSITIVDTDRRTARFDGTYQFSVGTAAPVTGNLIGAFVTPDHIWFKFLDHPTVFHETDLGVVFSTGEIFFQGATYEPSGATFSLRRR
jgi:hypothetical protein